MNIKKAKIIDKSLFDDIEGVVSYLERAKERGENIYIDFNGHKLYSANVTLDRAYLEVTGLSKQEYFARQRKIIKKMHKKAAEQKAELATKNEALYERGCQFINASKKQIGNCVWKRKLQQNIMEKILRLQLMLWNC